MKDFKAEAGKTVDLKDFTIPDPPKPPKPVIIQGATETIPLQLIPVKPDKVIKQQPKK